MRHFINGAAAAALIFTPLASEAAIAQSTPAATPAVAADGTLTLYPGAPITLSVAQEVTSTTHHAGDTFALTVLNDVRVGDTIVIPRGTPAQALITWRTGKGAFGKSGKLEFTLRYIELGGQRIPVTGNYRQEGEGNTVAAIGAWVAAGVIGGLVVTGHRARLPAGREITAQLAQPVSFTPAGTLHASYDGQAAWATAEAASPIGQCLAQARALPNQHAQERAGRNCFHQRLN